MHKKISKVDVEEQIAEILEHALHRSGGAKCKVNFEHFAMFLDV